MPEILSQQEIDSLLAGFSAGKSPGERISTAEEISVNEIHKEGFFDLGTRIEGND